MNKVYKLELNITEEMMDKVKQEIYIKKMVDNYSCKMSVLDALCTYVVLEAQKQFPEVFR